MATIDPAHLTFALRTHERLRELPRDGDLLWSPYSVAAALAMVAAGARGRTRDELDRYLAPGGSLDDLLDRVRAGAAPDTDAAAPDASGVAVANTLWAQQALPIVPAYEGLMRGMPGGAVRNADFHRDPGGAAGMINDDVAKTTRGLIREIVDANAVADADAVLVNALWVFVAWRERFAVRETRPRTFHAPGGDRQVPMMCAQRRMAYAEAAGWRMATVSGHGGLAMDVLLPDRPLSEAPPRPDDLAELYAAAREREVRLTLPRFEVEYGTELRPVVGGLGVPTMFAGDADLTGISPARLSVDKILHKARLRVDEAGAEGAAATAVVMKLSMAVQKHPPVDLTADRPFLIAVRHSSSGLLYFLAELTTPTDPGPAKD
ncbi:MAG TPA: serpin family protein [Streptosporangiaceae bacterium]|jgi:serpin B